MAELIEVPDDLKPLFHQIMRSAPEALCEDRQFTEAVLVYLRLGGVKLARQHVLTVTTEFCRGFRLEQQSGGEDQGDEGKVESSPDNDSENADDSETAS